MYGDIPTRNVSVQTSSWYLDYYSEHQNLKNLLGMMKQSEWVDFNI